MEDKVWGCTEESSVSNQQKHGGFRFNGVMRPIDLRIFKNVSNVISQITHDLCISLDSLHMHPHAPFIFSQPNKSFKLVWIASNLTIIMAFLRWHILNDEKGRVGNKLWKEVFLGPNMYACRNEDADQFLFLFCSFHSPP